MTVDADVKKFQTQFADVKAEIAKIVVGQDALVHRLLIGLIIGGHVLVEGVPGLAKTLLVRTLSQCLNASFSRIQFTPDMLPTDVIGTEIFNPRDASFSIKKGPVFGNLVLADEINRAPAKVQSALLEAMQEKQVTIGRESFKLDAPFLVMATQNPIEQEGTYPLPEAQLDRFMLKVLVGYLSPEEEVKVVERMAGGSALSEPRQIDRPPLNGRGIDLEVAEQYQKTLNDLKNIDITYKSRRSAKRFLTQELMDYEAGVGNVNQMISALQTFIEQRSMYLYALHDYRVSLVKLQKTVGTPNTDMLIDTTVLGDEE